MWNKRQPGLIEERVMARVQQLVQEGQSEFDEECAKIDREAESKKDLAADRIVSGILKG